MNDLIDRVADLIVAADRPVLVHPAASLPLHAKEAGATLVIVNRAETPHDRHAGAVIAGGAAAVRSAITERVQARLLPR